MATKKIIHKYLGMQIRDDEDIFITFIDKPTFDDACDAMIDFADNGSTEFVISRKQARKLKTQLDKFLTGNKKNGKNTVPSTKLR